MSKDNKDCSKCIKCEFYNEEKKERTDQCPNKDNPTCNFSTCTDFLISEKLVHF